MTSSAELSPQLWSFLLSQTETERRGTTAPSGSSPWCHGLKPGSLSKVKSELDQLHYLLLPFSEKKHRNWGTPPPFGK